MKRVKGFITLVLAFCAAFIFSVVVKADIAQVTGLKQVTGLSNSASISWNVMEDSTLSFEIQYSNSSDMSGASTVTGVVGTTSKVLVNLQGGTTYYVRVRAVSGVEKGAYSSVLSIVTAPQASSNIYQSSATTKSPTIKWQAASGATAYKIYVGDSYVATTTKLKYTLAKMPKNDVYVYSVRKNSAFEAVGDFATLPLAKIKLRAAKPKKVKVTNYFSASKNVLLEWNESNNADGYQIKYYVYNKKKAVDTVTTTSEKAMLDNVSAGKFYRAKVRGYSFINGKKKYGEWSKEIYFAYSVKDTYIRKVSGKYIYADWGNIKGATSYTIYVSKNITSGYKKVGKTKKSYFTIKKYAKKPLVPGTNYYVAIVANKKVGSKTYKTKRPTGIYLPHGF